MWESVKPWIWAILFVFGLLLVDAWLDSSEECFTDTCVEESE